MDDGCSQGVFEALWPRAALCAKTGRNITDTHVLVEEVESDSVLPPLHHIVVEGR